FEGGTPATSTEQNPIITYDIPGTYSVSLTIMKEGEEITLEKENYIEVAEKIKTAFTVNANSSPTIIEGSTITFNDESTGNPTNWQWFFEGGTPATSTEQNPTITYATPGIYNVQLKSSNDVHADSLLKEDFITVRSAFEAQFEADTTFVLEGREVKFTDNSTGEPTSWDWTFEGGTPESSTEQNPTVTYATAGNYNVSLKITKGNEQKTEEKTNYINVFQQVAAQFEADTTRIVEREFMSFEDNSIGEPTSWEWNFEGGDPETSTEQNPMVSYQSPGTYNVRLIVRNRVSSDTLEKAGYVTILDKVVASFLPTNTSVTENNAITFNDNSAGEPTSWEWTFEGGNPATSTEQNPQVTYATSGIYDVTLRVSNEFQSDIIQRNEYISVLEKSLVASYTLDNGSAIDEGDIGGFNGALNGPTAVPDRNAVANSALSFDGVNDRVETSNLIDDNLKAGASFAAWIYVSNLSSSRTIISNYNGTGAPGDCNERIGFNFRVLNDGKLNVAYITDGNDRVGRLSSVGDISINTWYHVVGTWDGNFSSSGFKLYIDGVQKDIADDKIGNICGIYMRESVQPFFIGDALCSTGFCAPFSGVVDEVKIYNYPLTENEIQTLSGL
ncbi:MAG: PKD domain-containing protein, partial [Bacteroidota bacterium]